MEIYGKNEETINNERKFENFEFEFENYTIVYPYYISTNWSLIFV